MYLKAWVQRSFKVSERKNRPKLLLTMCWTLKFSSSTSEFFPAYQCLLDLMLPNSDIPKEGDSLTLSLLSVSKDISNLDDIILSGRYILGGESLELMKGKFSICCASLISFN